MIYGYCRISRKQQSIERQERNIKANYPTALIIKEAFSGKSMDRPEWNKIMNKISSGDTIVFDSVSRMSRNADEGFEIYQILFNKGVSLAFLKAFNPDSCINPNFINLLTLALLSSVHLLFFIRGEKRCIQQHSS